MFDVKLVHVWFSLFAMTSSIRGCLDERMAMRLTDATAQGHTHMVILAESGKSLQESYAGGGRGETSLFLCLFS